MCWLTRHLHYSTIKPLGTEGNALAGQKEKNYDNDNTRKRGKAKKSQIKNRHNMLKLRYSETGLGVLR